MKSTSSLAAIFLRFFRLGCTAFGGPAMIPYIREAAVEREKWLTEDSFKLGMAAVQSMPGATAMQMAAYVGYRAGGLGGALAGYVGFGLPAFGLMLFLSWIYFTSRNAPAVLSLFAGLKVVVVALILNAALDLSRRYLTTLLDRLLALLAGVWLGLRGDPLLALVTICLLSVFLFRDLHAPGPESGQSPRPSFRDAGVILLAALAGLVLVWLAFPGLLDMALMMIKIDFFAFGGGYVSLPLMLHEVVQARGLMAETTFMDGIALGQVTPGPIVMSAAFVGYAVSGFTGALVSTLAVFSPSFFILVLCVPFLDRLARSTLAQRILRGSLATLAGLMAAMGGRFALSLSWGPAELAVGFCALAALRLGLDILWVVLFCAVLSILLF